MNKRMNKMDAKTLQQFLAFRKRAGRVPAKKGKGFTLLSGQYLFL